MSGYPYGREPPQYPNPNAHIYPQLYNPVNAPVPGQPGFPAPGQPGFPVPGQNAYAYQPGFAYPYQPNQPGQPGMPPSAMSYPGMPTTAPSAPAYGYPGMPNVTPTRVFEEVIQWVATTPDDAGYLSDRAVVAGYEGYDNSPLWVIRAAIEGDLVPGKLAIKHKAAYIPWGGKENPAGIIEVCCARPDRIKWIEGRDGSVPPNAVVAGNTASGEPLYVGRAREQGSLTPGKVHQSHKAMYLSFGGREIAHKVYEVLCTV